MVPQALSFTLSGSFLHSIYYDLVYFHLFIVWLSRRTRVSWGRDHAVLITTVLPVLRTLLGRVGTQWIFSDRVNESSKTWGCRLSVTPLLSISVPVPKQQTTGFIAFHLCLCHALARRPTHCLRVYKWRHSRQCQEAAKPWNECSSSAQQIRHLQPFMVPLWEKSGMLPLYLCLFYFNVQPIAPFIYVVSLRSQYPSLAS